MRSVQFFSACIFAALLLSCGSGTNKAFEFSETITRQEQSLIPNIEATESSLEKLFSAGNTDSAKIVSDNMAGRIQSSIDSIQNMAIPAGVKGGEAFKESALKYFNNLKSIYTGYSSVASQTDTAAYRIETEKLVRTVETKEQMVREIVNAQQKFARENNFKVTPLKN